MLLLIVMMCHHVLKTKKQRAGVGGGRSVIPLPDRKPIENSLQVSSSSPVKITDKCIHHSQTAAAHFVTKNQYGK